MTAYRERSRRGARRTGGRSPGSHAVAAGGPVRARARERRRRPPHRDGRVRRRRRAVHRRPRPAANWDEREAHDLYGVRFDGHEPLRPLVEHDLDVAALDGSGPGTRSLPGRGRPDPRRGDRVGPLPLPPRRARRSSTSTRGSSTSTAASNARPRARASPTASATSPEPALRAPSRTASPTRSRSRKRLGLRPSAELARARTILLELERVWSHLNDISAVCAGTGPCRRRAAVRRPDRAGKTAQRTPHGPPVPVRRSHASAAATSSSTRRQSRSRGRSSAHCASSAASGWRELVFNRSFDDRLLDVGVVRAKEARRLGATGPAARASGMAVDVRAVSPRLAYDGFAPVVPSRDGRRRQVPPRAATSRARPVVRPPRGAPRRPDRGVLRRTRRARAGDRGGTRREPARSDALRRRARRRPAHARPSADGLVRQLAGRRVRRGREHASGLPPHQQELRALLRLRRPLMLTLLRDLRRLRREIALPRPDRGRSLAVRHVDCGSCNGCEHELILASSPYTDLQRFGIGIVASPRHADVLLVTGPVTTRMRSPLLTAYAAMPSRAASSRWATARSGAASLVRPTTSSVRWRTCSRSSSRSPAAHRRRTRSPQRFSSSSTRAPNWRLRTSPRALLGSSTTPQ